MKINYSVVLLSAGLLGLAACSSQRTVGKRGGDAPRGVAQNSASTTQDPVLVGVTSKFLALDSSAVRVYVYVDAVKDRTPLSVADFGQLYNLNYVMYSDYGSRDRLAYGNVPLSPANVRAVDDKLVIQFELKRPKDQSFGVLLMEISQMGTLKKVLNDLPVRFTGQRDGDRLAVFEQSSDVPIRRHFVAQNEPVIIRSLDGSVKPLLVTYYRHGFDAAASPMNTAPRTGVAKKLSIDSTFTIESGQSVSFAQEGLYYIVSDTAQTDGLGLLVTDDRFPKMTRPDKLTEPLLYMSTNQEITEMSGASNDKKALDKYWLSLMQGNPELARMVIRSYYGRVEEANRLFTSYKEGWKTDKGMIFIILGPPDRVQRSKDKEVWVYDQKANATNVNFTFNKRTNQFVDDHYELVRYVEYQPIWYPVVEAWRNGAIR